jgi:diguanylate cyclase (GGDEF)-like protein
MIDVDWLKSINDTYGHPVGDKVLCQVARSIRNETRLVDIPARLGGDEFAVLLPKLEPENALMVAERIREAVASLPVVAKTCQLKVTVSMGVASYPAHDLGSPEHVVNAADKALYRAKLTPVRNQVIVWEPDQDTQSS